MFCIHCGTELPDGTKFCTQCGRPLDGAAPQRPDAPDAAPDFFHAAPPPQSDPTPAPPPVPSDERPTENRHKPQRPRKNRWALATMIAVILVVVSAIVAALILFRPWMMPAAPAGAQSGSASAAAPDLSEITGDTDDGLTAGDVNWSDYTGNWSAGGYRFSLLTERNLLTVTLSADGDSTQVACDLDVFSPEDPLPFGDRTLRLIPRAGGALRVSINGHVFDAIRSNNLPPDTQEDGGDVPSLSASDEGYLFYSPSTGTRSTGGVIPKDQPALHFWPLDQFAIGAADLDRLTRDEIDIIRNETFARHGYVFTSDAWADFFAAYDWYTPDPSFTEEGFSKLEKQNIDTIVLYEQEKGWL